MNIEEERKICLLILIGLPGCGKTTFSSYLVQCLEDPNITNELPFQCIIHVCYDKILNSSEVQWNEARRITAKTIDEMVGKLKNGNDPELLVNEYNLNLNKNPFFTNPRILIVIDDNMYYRSMRYQYYQIARTHQLSFCQLFLKCDVGVCAKRNSQRSTQEVIPEGMIFKMAANLEEPNRKHPWESFTITLNSEEHFNHSSLAALYIAINEAFSQPVQPLLENPDKELSQILCSSNIIHQADLILRKIIGIKIKGHKQHVNHERIQELSTHLNNKKQDILHELKTGKLQLPHGTTKGLEGNTSAISSLHSLLSETFTERISECTFCLYFN